MKKLLFLCFILCSSTFLQGQVKLDYNNWQMIHEDEFDYSIGSDSQKEAIMETKGWRLQGDICTQNASKNWSHVDTENGYLILSVTANGGPVDNNWCDANGFPGDEDEYTSGGIESILPWSSGPCKWVPGNLSNGNPTIYGDYGLYEIRCKLPDANSGVKSSFWLWNGFDEVDVFEFESNHPNKYNSAFHDWCGGGISSNDFIVKDQCTDPNGALIDEFKKDCINIHSFTRDITKNFHTFSVVWTPDQYTFFMDGREVRTDTRYDDSGCAEKIIISATEKELGGDPNSSSDFIIDYLRIYSKANINSDYMYDYLPGTVTTSPDIYNRIKSLDVGTDNKVFYRSTSNWMEHRIYSNGWQNVPLPKNSTTWKVYGDVVYGNLNQVFYRGSDSRMQVYYFQNGEWKHGTVDDNYNSNARLVSSQCGAIAIGTNNKLFYRNLNNEMNTFFFNNGINDWQHGPLPVISPDHKVGGDIVVDEDNHIFYRGQDGRLQVYWYTNFWNHGYIGDNSSYNVNSSCGSLATRNSNEVFYRGEDNKMHYYQYNNSEGWVHEILPTDLNDQKVNGDIDIGANKDIFYTGNDGEMQMYYYHEGFWYHMWVDEEINKPNNEKLGPFSSIAVGTKNNVNQIFYRSLYGDVKNYYRVSIEDGELVNKPCISNFNSTSSNMRDKSNGFNEQLDLLINIYPNPNSGLFTVKGENEEIFDQIFIYNAIGNEIKNITCIDCKTTNIDIQSQPKGIYYIRIEKGEKMYFEKLVKL